MTNSKDIIPIPETDEALLSECIIETFRASGPGGQHINTTDSAVRLKHKPSGITVTSKESRSQHKNKETCLKKLREKIEKQNFRYPKRIATKKSRTVKDKQLQEKKRQSMKKQLRSKRDIGD